MYKYLVFCLITFSFFSLPQLSYGQDLKINEKGDTIIQFNDGSWRYFTDADKNTFATQLQDNEGIKAQGLEDLLSLQKLVQAEVHLKTQEARAINLNRFNLEKSIRETVDADKIEQLKRKLRLENYNHSKTKTSLKAYLQMSRLISELVPNYTAAKFKKYQEILQTYQAEKGLPISNFENIASVDTDEQKVKNTRTQKTRVKKTQPETREKRPKVKDLAELEESPKTRVKRNRNAEGEKITKTKPTEIKTQVKTQKFDAQNSLGGGSSISNSKALFKLPWVDEINVVHHSDCVVESHKIDDFTQKKRIDLERQFLFSYTDEKLRPFLKGQELLVCEAALTSLGGFSYLNLTFSIASPNARNNFGVLENNAQISLKLINGNTITLYNSNRDIGKIDPYSGNTVYNGLYIISAANEKLLSKTELDELRVIWSTGYEDYEIYEIDFFINQLTCLKNSKTTTEK